MKFIADAMLGSLAKRLRLNGYDVVYDTTFTDNDILRIALEQDRFILTRNHDLAGRPLARNHLLIDSDFIDNQIQQVLSISPPQERGSLTRCSVCNGVLSPLERSAARDSVPEHVYASVKTFFHCEHCGRVYWEGSHVKNMAARQAGERSDS